MPPDVKEFRMSVQTLFTVRNAVYISMVFFTYNLPCCFCYTGKCTLGDECPLSHDAVPETHCPTFNTTGQCFDELCPLLHRLVEYAPAAAVIVISNEEQGQGHGQNIPSLALEEGGEIESAAPGAESELKLAQSAACASGAREDHEMQVDDTLEQCEIGLDIAQVDGRNGAPVEETVACRFGNEPGGEPAAAATEPIVLTTISTTTTTTASVSPATAATIAVDDENENNSARDAAPIIATTKTITTTINTHPSPADTYVGSKVPGTSRDTPFDLLLDTYQHHSRSTSPAKTLASTIHSTRPATVTVIVPSARCVEVSAKPTVSESKKPEDGEVCEKASRSPVVPVKKGKSRFDEDAPTGAAGATTTTGSSVVTLPLPSQRDGPTTVSTVSSATGGGRSPPGICYNFKKGACDRGNSCRFSHDLDSEVPASGVCHAFQKGNCEKGDQCRFRHLAPGACYNYARGVCDRGDTCSYRHDAPAAPQEPARGVCYAFQKGECNKGDNCFFRHVASNITAGACFNFRRGACNLGDSCRFSHDPDAVDQRGVCFEFQSGACSKGDGCLFRHIREDCRDFQRGHCPRGNQCPFSHGNNVQNVPAKADAPHSTDGRDACFDYIKGSCTFGDTCRYSHSGNNFGTAGVCRLFQRGECTKGDKCRYKHELEACRAFLRGYCRNGDDCRYHHPSGATSTASTSKPYDADRGAERSPNQPPTSHYQSPQGKRGRSFSRSPSRSPSRARKTSKSDNRSREDSSSRG